MKAIKLLSAVALIVGFASCAQLQQATNTTGGAVFTLNGKWQLGSNDPEGGLLNSIVTVTPFISQGSITTLQNNTRCLRENDVIWRAIKTDNAGGYTLENLVTNCTQTQLTYQPATITVISANQIRIIGVNAAGQNNVQTWTRMQ